MDKLKQPFLTQLREAYSTEAKLLNVLSQITPSIISTALWNIVSDYITNLKEHIKIHNEIFETLYTSPTGQISNHQEALVNECLSIIEQKWSDMIQDTALVTQLQNIADYKIQIYQSIHTHLTQANDNNFLSQVDRMLAHEYGFKRRLYNLSLSQITQVDNLSESASTDHLPINEIVTTELNNDESQ